MQSFQMHNTFRLRKKQTKKPYLYSRIMSISGGRINERQL